ncbi:hypothetical protein E0485_05820 [Paenibacillus albiflavus]|uniref:Uncharacterized protein n=1 Tax=Paenibacillus albiflavus TaxID=2545760 RepID=A0A4R4EM26_9BACL|nr:hypothetical protein [Paenibacillus albiflavus]TCZ79378.1 hypothetical protein E0485_05820 [Paenibacillus albiflavus]
MKFIKLNHKWNAEPNSPEPNLKIHKQNLKLRFLMNPYQFPEFDEDDVGILEFYDCYMYRIGPTNDEGFYRGYCRFSSSGVKWGEFYQVEESNWKEDFPEDKVILEDLHNENELKHYLFYFKDETFECIAKGYGLKVIKANSDEANNFG